MPNNSNVDERIVEMRIDNTQFVNGAEKTITILDRLKKALSFGNAADGFDSIQKSADNVDLTGMAADLDEISSRFSNMGLIGMNVIRNLTDSVTGFLTSTIKGLTIDPVLEGFSKYEDIARSTATILAATRGELDEFGSWGSEFGSGLFDTQLEYVTSGLETLTWYADETSAAMTDMVSNIGKFTNAGVRFENAVVEMMGVTNWGYLAGAGKAEQARAMYNLSQAIATGSVRLMDWRSIENANMATMEFKETVMDTAVEMGTLRKAADGTYKTLDGVEVTAANFSQTLSSGWFTSGVLEKTLMQYGEFSRRLDATLTDTGMALAGLGASDVLKAIDRIASPTDDYSIQAWYEDLAKIMGEENVPSIEALTYQYELLTDAEVELSRRAFLAGQEYRTFSDAIDYVRDAVSSQWMKTFELIIGDTEEAKLVWSALGEELGDIFGAAGRVRNAVLSLWKNPGQEGGLGNNWISGRESLLSAIVNLYNGVRTYIDPILEAFRSVFSFGDTTHDMAERLLNITYRFEEWTEKIGLTEDAVKGVRNVFTKLFSAVRGGLGIFSPFFKVIGTGFQFIHDTVNLFFESFASGEFDKEHFLSGMPDIFNNVGDGIRNAWDRLRSFIDAVKDIPIVGSVLSGLQSAIDSIIAFFSGAAEDSGELLGNVEGLETPLGKAQELWGKIWGYITNISIDTEQLREDFGKVGEIIGTVYEGLVGDPEEFKERVRTAVGNALTAVKEALSSITFSDVFEGAKAGTLLYVALQFASFVSSFKQSVDSFKTIPESISGVFNTLSKSISRKFKTDSIFKLAAAMALLAAAMFVMALIPQDKLAEVAVILAFLFIVLERIANKASGFADNFSNNKVENALMIKLPGFAIALLGIAAIIAAATVALIKLSELSWDDIGRGLTAIGAVLLLAVISIIALSKNMDEVNPKALGKLVAVALVIKAAGKAMSALKDMDWTQIISAGVALGIVIAAVAAAMFAIKGVSADSGFGALLSAISVISVMYAMVPLLTGISVMLSQEGGGTLLLKSLGVLALAGGLIVIFMALISKIGSSKGALAGAAAMALVGASLLLFASSLAIAAPAILALLTGLIGVWVLLTEISSTYDLSGTFLLLAGLAVILVAVGVAALAIGAGMLLAGAGFAAFGAGLLEAAVAIGILAVALVPLGEAIIAFGELISEHGDVIVGVISMIVLGVLAAIVASKMQIAASVVAIVVSVLGIILSVGDQLLKILGAVLAKVLGFLLTLAPMVITFLVAAIVLILDGTGNALRKAGGALESAIENLLSAIFEVFNKVFFQLVGDVFAFILNSLRSIPGIGTIIDSILTAFGLDADTLGQQIRDSMGSFGDTVADVAYEAFGGAEREASGGAAALVDAFTEEFAGSSGDVTEALSSVMSTVTDGVLPSAETTGTTLGGATMTSFVDGAEDTLSEAMPDFTSVIGSNMTGALDISELSGGLGDNAMTSYVNNIYGTNGENHVQDAYDAAYTVSNAGVQGLADGQQSHSPSRLTARIGRFFVEGYVGGIDDNADEAYSASKNLAIKMADALETALGTVSALAEDDFNISPTITPVVDMTNVDSAASSVEGMFSSDTSSRISRISRTMADIDALASNMRNFAESKAETTNNTYEVNIYTSEGMDEEAIAEEVVFRISNGLVRKGAALG